LFRWVQSLDLSRSISTDQGDPTAEGMATMRHGACRMVAMLPSRSLLCVVTLGLLACSAGAADGDDIEGSSSEVNQRRGADATKGTKRPTNRSSDPPSKVQLPLGSLDQTTLPAWTRADLDRAFSRVRDTRAFSSDVAVNGEPENFPRRLPWLFPSNGCEVRAIFAEQLVAKPAEGWAPLASPKRIFLFPPKGKLLQFATSLEDAGFVEWKVHVANIVAVDGAPFILDPAVEPRHALPLDEWAGRTFDDIHALGAALCSPNSYRPDDDPCNPASPAARDEATASMRMTLRMEWATLKLRGLDTFKLLGDAPPWLDP
jgi:hypothetical protein